MNVILEKLKKKKIKITPQRLAVYSVLHNTTTHPSADSIYRALEPEWPTLSLATVYKTLEALTDVGLVIEITACRQSMRYDANTQPHGHLVCMCCNEVYDYSAFEISSDEMENIKNNHNFSSIYKEINYYGKCENCSRGDVNVC